MKKKNPIEEARRYVQNAKDVLNEKTKLNVETRPMKTQSMCAQQAITFGWARYWRLMPYFT